MSYRRLRSNTLSLGKLPHTVKSHMVTPNCCLIRSSSASFFVENAEMVSIALPSKRHALLTRVHFESQIKAGKDSAAASAHLWLEKNAFFKVPRALQDETMETHQTPFEDVRF